MGLLACSNGAIRAVRAFSVDETDRYHDALECLLEHHASPLFLEMVQSNEKDFIGAMKEWQAEGPRLVDSPSLRSTMTGDINRRLVNYLATFRLFLDSTQTRLKRRYDRSSAPVKALKAATESAFDEEFAYRFLYKLRNYSQHHGMPIGHVHVTHSLPTHYKDRPEHEVTLMFDTAALLSHGGDVWGTVATELAAAGPLLSIQPLVRTATRRLEAISRAVAEAERPALVEAAATICQLLQDGRTEREWPAAAEITHSPPYQKIRFFVPPRPLMEHLGFEKFPIAYL